MAVFGYNVQPVAAVSATDKAVKAHGDELMWIRKKLASLLDQAVEPDDIEADDGTINLVREA